MCESVVCVCCERVCVLCVCVERCVRESVCVCECVSVSVVCVLGECECGLSVC